MMLAGMDLLKARGAYLAQLHGKAAAIIFQEAMTAFDPSFTISHQIAETIMAHRPARKAEALALLARVEIRNRSAALDSYPHQLSGGVLQLIKNMQTEFGIGLIMVTHDLGIIAETVDHVMLMYGARVMEQARCNSCSTPRRFPIRRPCLPRFPVTRAGGNG